MKVTYIDDPRFKYLRRHRIFHLPSEPYRGLSSQPTINTVSQGKEASWSPIFLEVDVVGTSGSKRKAKVPKRRGWLSVDPTQHPKWFE